MPFDAKSTIDPSKIVKSFCQMIEEIKLSCNETVIQKTLDGKFLVCLSEGVCLEYPCLWDAQDHLRNLELCGLMTKR